MRLEAVQTGRLPLSGGRGEHRDVSPRPGCSFAWPGTSPPPAAAPAAAQPAHVSLLLSWSSSSLFSMLLHQRFPWAGVRAAGLAALLHSFLVPARALLQRRAHTCCRRLSPLATSWTSRLPKCLPRTKFRLGEVHDEERERGIPGQGRSRAFQVLKKRHVHGLVSLSHQRGEHQDSMP